MIVRFPTTEIQKKKTSQNKASRKGFFIPDYIMRDKRLNATERVFLSKIKELQDQKVGGCFASNAYLSQHLKVSDRYIRKMLTKLKTIGLIEQVKVSGFRRVLRVVKGAENE